MKRLLIVFAIGWIFLFTSPVEVSADGMIVPPPNYWVEETDQKAVIFHQGDQETLILSITFRGDAEDFGWIIPLPTRPEIDKSTDELFVALRELTQQRYRIQEGEKIGIQREMPSTGGVTVWETKKVGIYQTAILTSTDKTALADWLKENGYQYPTSQAYILQEYINRGWYFVAAKINTQSLGRLVEGQLKQGHATPLQLTFKTDKPFYPLKISSAMSDFLTRRPTPTPSLIPMPMQEGKQPQTEVKKEINIPRPPRRLSNISVSLYVFTDHKSYLPGFDTLYAGWLKKRKIENLAQIQGKPWIKVRDGKYLTRLHRQYSLAEMNNDLWIRQAEDDQPVGAGESKFSFLSKEKRILLILGVPLILEILVVTIILVALQGKKNEPQEHLA